MSTNSNNTDSNHNNTDEILTGPQQDLVNGGLTVLELDNKGVSIRVQAKWWGFTIELNNNAVVFLNECFNYLDEKLNKHFKESKLRRAISFYIQFKQERLSRAVNAEGSGGLVRMVSPWVIPVALVVVRGKMNEKDDYNLWFTVWDNDQNAWGEDAEFHECMTRNGPALAQHGDFLYCVHRGYGDNNLWWTKYSTDDGWSDDTMFPQHHTDSNTSLVDFNGTLYCCHRGASDEQHVNNMLYYCTFDGVGSWNTDTKIEVNGTVFKSDTGCAVAVFNKELHLVYQSTDSNNVHHLIFDGTNWRNNGSIPNCETADTPALVAYKDKLLMVHRGHTDQDLWYNNYSNGSWTGDNKINPIQSSKYGPSLAVFDNKVYMVHRGANNDQHLWHSTYDGTNWTQDKETKGVCLGAPPALVCYKDPECTEKNYVDPNVIEDETDPTKTVELPPTYQPRLICVHRGIG